MVDPDLLLEVPMFQTLPTSERQRIAAMMREERVPEGRVIFEVGDPGASMYIVERGRIRISVPGDSGAEVTLATLGTGEFFGELALLDQNPRSARATAAEDTTLLSLGRDQFLAFVTARPDTALAMLHATAKRLRHTDELMRSRASFDVNEEFARHETRGGRWADRLARYAGSWTFISIYIAVIFAWIGCNLFLRRFDSAYFELLSFILGFIATLQAPIIIMSQNRDQLRDRIRADADFQVNLKNEVAIEKALERLEEMRRQIPELKRQVKEHETVVRKSHETIRRLMGKPSGAAAPAHGPSDTADVEDLGSEGEESVVGEGTAVFIASDVAKTAGGGAEVAEPPSPVPARREKPRAPAAAAPGGGAAVVAGEETQRGVAAALRAFRGEA